MGTRNAFPWSAKQKLRISSAGVAPDVSTIFDGLNGIVPPMTLDMKPAMACMEIYIQNSGSATANILIWHLIHQSAHDKFLEAPISLKIRKLMNNFLRDILGEDYGFMKHIYFYRRDAAIIFNRYYTIYVSYFLVRLLALHINPLALKIHRKCK